MGFVSVIKSIGSSFSLYSRIPIPNAVWKGEKPKYTLGFFPWVGAVIGVGEYLLYRFLPVSGVPLALCMAVLPLILTGGIHVDGFMDTSDAFHSYGDKQKKLEILKDPHIGAFAVIRVLILAALYLAGLLVLTETTGSPEIQKEAVLIFAGSFILGRSASGCLMVLLPPAKKDGMAAEIKKDSARRGNCVLLFLQGGAVIIAGLIISPLLMTASVMALFLVTARFLFHHVAELEGITGDLAGWYLTVSECAMLLMTVAVYLALKVV